MVRLRIKIASPNEKRFSLICRDSIVLDHIHMSLAFFYKHIS